MNKNIYLQKLKQNYLKASGYQFGKAVPLEDISDGLNISGTLENFLNEDKENKFKIELLMFPAWATKKKSYKIFKDPYTHLKIKKDF